MEGCEICTLSHSIDGHRSHVFIFLAGKSYYKNKVNFGHAIHFSTSRGKMEGCESCPLSQSMDQHRSHVSIFLLAKVFIKRRLILDMQIIFVPVGVKWNVVKYVHCPLLLMDTGLTSLSSC